MSPSPAACSAGEPLFITQRGYERGTCFFDTEDYLRYREILRLALERHGAQLHAYCLIRNHVQLLLTPDASAGLGPMLREICLAYNTYRAERSGARLMLWEARYRGRPIPADERILRCYRYIEEHPVALGLAHAPGAYRWSSYHHNGYHLDDALITEHPAYRALADASGDARGPYRGLFQGAMPQFDRSPSSIIYAA